MAELIDLVDINNKVIGTTDVATAHQQKQLHRVVGILLFDSSGSLYLQNGNKYKKYDLSVGVHVGQGETYEQAAHREMKEELGVDVKLIDVSTFLSSNAKMGHFWRIYQGELPIDEVVLDNLQKMQNYKEALKELINSEGDLQDRIINAGLNRKSSNYDKPYFKLFTSIEKISKHGLNDSTSKELMDSILKLSGKAKIKWKQKVFGLSLSSQDQKVFLNAYWKNSEFNSTDNKTLLENFFWAMHFIKWKVNLEEYADLNRRFFQIADVLIFKDGKIQLQLFAKYFFKECIDSLISDTPIQVDFTKNFRLEEISTSLSVSPNKIFENISIKVGKKIDAETAYNYLNEERKELLEKLIDEKFSKSQLVILLNKIQLREDDSIQDYVTNNADAPTIFEYILAICWYKISDGRFDLLNSMRLSLDANMLPKTHASGGQGDIYIKYTKVIFSNPHNLLIEATLTNNSQQRRAEMEPVSRHLGQLLVENAEIPSYCVFVSNYLDKNVIFDFRSRKSIPYTYGGKTVYGMKIIPIDIDLVIHTLQQEISYDQLYEVFDNAFRSEIEYDNWYEKEVKESIMRLS